MEPLARVGLPGDATGAREVEGRRPSRAREKTGREIEENEGGRGGV